MIELVITAVIRGLSLFLCMESKEDVSISLENGQEERQNDLLRNHGREKRGGALNMQHFMQTPEET